jgi:hypothetical protein
MIDLVERSAVGRVEEGANGRMEGGSSCLEEMRPESGRGIPFAFKMVCKPQTLITNMDKH